MHANRREEKNLTQRRKGKTEKRPAERRSSRQSLVPVDPILPSNSFAFRSAKAVSSDQQGQAITDRIKADADPGGIKAERREHPQAKNDADNQLHLRPQPERQT